MRAAFALPAIRARRCCAINISQVDASQKVSVEGAQRHCEESPSPPSDLRVAERSLQQVAATQTAPKRSAGQIVRAASEQRVRPSDSTGSWHPHAPSVFSGEGFALIRSPFLPPPNVSNEGSPERAAPAERRTRTEALRAADEPEVELVLYSAQIQRSTPSNSPQDHRQDSRDAPWKNFASNNRVVFVR